MHLKPGGDAPTCPARRSGQAFARDASAGLRSSHCLPEKRCQLRGESLAVEVSADSLLCLDCEASRETRAAVQMHESVRECYRIVRRNELAVDAVANYLGDARDGGGDDRQTAGHRLHQHVRNTVAVARFEDAAGQAKRGRSHVLLIQPRLTHWASQVYPMFEAEGADEPPKLFFMLAVLTND